MKISTPYQHPDSGIYYYRRAVSLAIKNTLGKTMIKVSLKTRSPLLAIKKFTTVDSTCERLFEALYDALTGHSNQSIGRRYGMGYLLQRKNEAINRVNYPI